MFASSKLIGIEEVEEAKDGSHDGEEAFGRSGLC